MSSAKNENTLDEVIGKSRVDELKSKILAQRRKVFELLNTDSGISNSIYDLLLVISNDYRIENIDDVCEFMDEIKKKYGLVLAGESDLSRLYEEIHNEKYRETLERMVLQSAQYGDGSFSVEFVNSDEEMFNNPNIDSEELARLLEERLELYKSLIHNVELSNYEHQLLLGRLQVIQKHYDELAKKEDISQIRYPRIEDYEI